MRITEPEQRRLPLARDPEVQGGEPTFPRTRTPARILLDYLGGGYTVEDFLRDFPHVDRGDALALLDTFRDALPAFASEEPGLDAPPRSDSAPGASDLTSTPPAR